ncbi:hypothetical protein C8T65DRAFT_278807 [Cerioporus squamosus]|nr:hypothetical protein C8T65DRAFT_278807 [Cerioporus squamosus]
MSYSYGHSALIQNRPRVMTQDYCIMASSALLWYDFGLTFTSEVQHIWQREFSWVSLAYVYMRYTMFVDRVTLVLQILLWNVNDQTCSILTHTNDAMYIMNLLATAVLVIVRVYGISAKNWRWLLIVSPLNLVRPVLYAIESARYFPIQGGPPFGCTYDYTLSDVTLARVCDDGRVSRGSRCRHDDQGVLHQETCGEEPHAHTAGDAAAQRRTSILDPPGVHSVRELLRYPNECACLPMPAGVSPVSVQHLEGGPQSATLFLVWPYFYEIIYVIILSHFILDARGLSHVPSQAPPPPPPNIHTLDMPRTDSGRRLTTLMTGINNPIPPAVGLASTSMANTTSTLAKEDIYDGIAVGTATIEGHQGTLAESVV